jgi:hypothetical protein
MTRVRSHRRIIIDNKRDARDAEREAKNHPPIRAGSRKDRPEVVVVEDQEKEEGDDEA